jgi:cell wall-associated NlpC family hydrolase
MDCRSALGRPRVLVCVAAIVGTATAVVPFASSASADPLSTAKAQAAALAQRIATEQSQVEALSNQYDAAQYHLSQIQAQVAQARRQLAASEANTQRVRQAVTREAVHEYTSGGFTPQPGRTAVSPLVAESYFQVASGTQTDALDQYRAAERQLASDQQQLTQAEKGATAAVSALNGRRQAVMAAQSQAQSTLSGVKGRIAQLVAQAQAAAAARLRAQQEAAYAAQQAAARQRAAEAAATTASVTRASQSQSGLSVPPATTAPTSPSPSPSPTPSPRPAPSPTPTPTPHPTGSAQQIAVSVALAQVGKPYQWGAAGPGSFDCSGLVMYAYEAAGISLPHYTGAQWAATTQIPLADAQPGDLIFFNGLQHVGMYLGNGMMVDAPHTGAFVRVEPIFGFGSIDGATRVG